MEEVEGSKEHGLTNLFMDTKADVTLAVPSITRRDEVYLGWIRRRRRSG